MADKEQRAAGWLLQSQVDTSELDGVVGGVGGQGWMPPHKPATARRRSTGCCGGKRSHCGPRSTTHPAHCRKKKAKKYIQVATLRRPTAATVAEAYFSSSPAKTGYLRADALALLLSLANVGAHAHVLVVETCGGLVSAAALERAGSAPGAGAGVASAWVGGGSARRPSLDIWRSFNFPAAQRAALRFAPLSELLAETRQDAEQQGAAAAAMEQQRLQAQVAAAATQQQEVAVAAAGEEAEAMQEDEGQPAAQQEAQQQQQQQQLAEDIAAAANTATAPAAAAAAPASEAGGEGGKADGGAAAAPPPVRAPFNSCILTASSVSPLALIQHVLPLLAPSASLAVYCQWAHPLAEALDALRGQGRVAGLALHECWWREMQVCGGWVGELAGEQAVACQGHGRLPSSGDVCCGLERPSSKQASSPARPASSLSPRWRPPARPPTLSPTHPHTHSYHTQVLPLRTHPTMNMNHGGGFILAGTVLAPAQAK